MTSTTAITRFNRIKSTVEEFNRNNSAHERMTVCPGDRLHSLELTDAKGRRILFAQPRGVAELQRLIKRLS